MDVPSNAYTEPITPSHASSRRPRVQGIEGAAPAAAAEFPKTGSAEYDTYYVDNTVAKIDSGAGTGAIVDSAGVTRNVKGEGPFHDMSMRCLYHTSSMGETVHYNGSCVETDKDGDNVFTTSTTTTTI